MISLSAAATISIMVAFMAALAYSGKVLEKYFPEKEPTFESGAGAPAPSRDATIDALYNRVLADPDALYNYIDEGKPSGYQIVDYMVENDIKWEEAVWDLTGQMRTERQTVVDDVYAKYQLAA